VKNISVGGLLIALKEVAVIACLALDHIGSQKGKDRLTLKIPVPAWTNLLSPSSQQDRYSFP